MGKLVSADVGLAEEKYVVKGEVDADPTACE